MRRENASRLERATRRLARPLVAVLRKRRRAAARRAKARAKALRRQTAAAPARPRPRPPLLSVVVAVEDDRHLRECLASLEAQTLARLEIVLVGAEPALVPQVATGSRVRRVPRPEGGGLAAGRNRGAAAARGTYLAFVDAADTVPPEAFAQLVRTLQRSGSDFALGDTRLVRRGRSRRNGLPAAVHDLDRVAVSVDDFPPALQDVTLGNRVFRRTFWTDRVGGFDETSGSSELEAVATGYIRARTFDVVRAVTYQVQVRPDATSLVEETVDAAFLGDRLPALGRIWKLVAAEGSAAVAGAWLGGLVETDLARWAAQAATADETFRSELQGACRAFFDAATPETWPHVSLDSRVRSWLARQGRWAALELFVEHMRIYGPTPPTRLVGDRVLAELPLADQLGDDLPDLCRELSASETTLAACVRSARFEDDGVLVVDGWAFVPGVDLSEHAGEQRAVLVDVVTGAELPVPLERRPDPAATRWAGTRYQDFAESGFRLRIDVDALPALGADADRRLWRLRLDVRVGELVRSGPVSSVLRAGSGMRLRARPLRDPADPVRLMPVLDPVHGFAVQARRDRVRALELGGGDGGQVRGRLRRLDPDGPRLVSVRATAGPAVLSVDLEHAPDGTASFGFRLPPGPLDEHWAVVAVDEAGHRHRISWPAESAAGSLVAAPDASAVWARTPRGLADLQARRRGLLASSVELDDTSLTVRGRVLGLDRATLAASRLTSHRTDVAPTEVELGADGAARLVFPLQGALWGGPVKPLPSAAYTVQLGDDGPLVSVTDALLERCPDEGVREAHGYRVARTRGTDVLEVTLRAPLRTDELGRSAATRLADWYADVEVTPQDAVLMSCYRGEFATDSQLALHEELRRRGTGLRLLWGVRDHSVVLPDGAEPLLIGSREWYAAMASSRYLCHNIDMERWFRKRPHQRYLQTFHGYPFKSMGASLWRAYGRGELVIEQESRRRTDAWDAIVVPEEFCVELYRREYGYGGPALVTGYPRDDALVLTDPVPTRAEVLARLGVPTDTTVVLYAPTWRDTAAISAYRAELFDGLDLDRLVRDLGPGYTVLVRGHNYNLRGGSGATSTRVLDVSGYPEVNDLILAADVAVLDYSSLRFDWMITGKPVAFFVPDLEDYVSSRRVLLDYGPTAPGPLLRTPQELVAVLRDLDGLTRRYAEDRAAANRRFNRLHDGHASERLVDAFFS